MKIEKTQVFGFEAAFRAIRNPKDSWALSDSQVHNFSQHNTLSKNYNIEGFVLGERDMALSTNLTKAGSEHCKHLRMIQVWVDMTLPRYIWQEFDTYRHVEKISCSTMHKLMSYDLNEEMFEEFEDDHVESNYSFHDVIFDLRNYIESYKLSKNVEEKKRLKYYVKSMLPESFLQKRTLNTNYQQLYNIRKQRKFHELPQWQEICTWIEKLPYFIESTGIG